MLHCLFCRCLRQALQQEGVSAAAIESILEDCDRDNDRCAAVPRQGVWQLRRCSLVVLGFRGPCLV
jgi:hypothetical protein